MGIGVNAGHIPGFVLGSALGAGVRVPELVPRQDLDVESEDTNGSVGPELHRAQFAEELSAERFNPSDDDRELVVPAVENLGAWA